MTELKAGAAARNRRAGDSERALGRGLEDVSRLFVSQLAKYEPKPRARELVVKGEDVAEPTTISTAAAPLPAASPIPVLLRPAMPVTADRFAAVLKELDGLIESGLTLIDEKLPCSPWDPIDLVGVDRDGRLTILDVDIQASDDLMLRGLGHFDWLVENIPTLQRMYVDRGIQFGLQPRVLLLAPAFSNRFKTVLRRIPQTPLECIRYQLIDLPGTLGVLFDPEP